MVVNVNIRRDPPKNTDLAQCAMPSARHWRAQARDHCACARENPTRKAVRWQKFYVLPPSDSSASSTMSAACCWQSPSRRAKAPSARRTAPDQLAWSAWSLATTVWPLQPPASRERSRLTSTSNHSACRCRALRRGCVRDRHHGLSSSTAPERFTTSVPC